MSRELAGLPEPPQATPTPKPPSPPPVSTRVLFVHQDLGRSRGLSVNSDQSVAVLARLGIRAASWGYRDITDVLPLVRSLPGLRVVVLQGGRYDPETLDAITAGPPGLTWWLRCHSNPAFLAVEPGTVASMRRWHAMASDRPNLRLAGVSARFVADWTGAYGGDALHLPNLYALGSEPPQRASRTEGPLSLACFGASRLQKHGTVAAVAAAIIARKTGRPVHFKVNGGPEHPGANSVIDAIQAFLANVPGVTLEMVPWHDHGTFTREHVSTLDIHLQPSASETFNITVADCAARGIPSVVGPAIEWMPADMTAPVDDATAVAEVGLRLLADPTSGARAHAALATHCQAAERTWLDALATAGIAPPATPAPPLPSLARQAVGLVVAGVQALASGGETASPEVVAARLAVCETCDHFRPSDRRCGGATGCGCYVDIKARLIAWDCPLGRWPSVT